MKKNIIEFSRYSDVKEITVKLLRGKFLITTNTRDEEKIKDALTKWYREKMGQLYQE
ncbi:hypothetical protein [Clostridium butyricum]|nr:hypothetical protein [Clostridium butyricum]NOW23501.1 hypothetical protein [Clostridium butyricum]